MSNGQYPRNDLWVRKPYEPLVMGRFLTTFFRPGDRVSQTNLKHFILGEELTIRFLDRPGCEERGYVPIINGNSRKVRVTGLEKKNIEDLTKKDFEGSSPDVQNILQLKYNLGITYNKPINEIQEITKINVEYLY